MSEIETPTIPTQPTAPPPFWWATGRRKSAVARVRLVPNGTGKIMANKREFEEYWPREQDRIHIVTPLQLTKTAKNFDIHITLNGGGMTGQAGAARLGIARALVKSDESTYLTLKEAGYLTRDSRQVERKKPGKKGARASFQFSKR